MITSLFIPARFGRSTIFFGSPPVSTAAVPRVMADAAPHDTMAASAFTSSAIRAPTLSCRSLRNTKFFDA